jgi:hypothetical protein
VGEGKQCGLLSFLDDGGVRGRQQRMAALCQENGDDDVGARRR